MQDTANLARRMSRRSRQANIAKPVGELAALASGARFSNLAQLLAKAQLEAELWSRHSA
jgi:hypothetical protein